MLNLFFTALDMKSPWYAKQINFLCVEKNTFVLMLLLNQDLLTDGNENSDGFPIMGR
ncbi:MAG: hypothetical protein Q9M11_01390 [Mariprofundaceae bacterium]|nr:hypothetical protein [Mariprofundaceae bacterium]